MSLARMKEGHIPRWLVESDPSWEKAVDSNPSMLRWTKKGTNGSIAAVCSPTSMFCELVGVEESKAAGLFDPVRAIQNGVVQSKGVRDHDITKYLSSRYLNPQFGSNMSAFDPKKRWSTSRSF